MLKALNEPVKGMMGIPSQRLPRYITAKQASIYKSMWYMHCEGISFVYKEHGCIMTPDCSLWMDVLHVNKTTINILHSLPTAKKVLSKTFKCLSHLPVEYAESRGDLNLM